MDQTGFVISGECPHCRKQAAFPAISGAYEERASDGPTRMIAAARCIACNEYILAILRIEALNNSRSRWVYDAHYPLGKPNDAVADEIPDAIKADFREALRCRWVNAYRAAIEMCGRALESSCLQLGADSSLVLSEMIDWVHAQGKITKPLHEMAHKIKLGRIRTAHPSEGPLKDRDADAVIEFAREFFQDVYVLPARMARFNLDKLDKKGKQGVVS